MTDAKRPARKAGKAAAPAAAAAVSEPTTEPAPAKPKLSTKDKLAKATLPTKDVPVCLSTDLQQRYEALHERLAEAYAKEKGDKRLNPAGESKRIAAQVEALQEEMREYVITFRVRSLGRRWQQLMDKHPPREGNNEDVYLGYNPVTFADAAVRACVAEPDDLDDEDWADLLGDDERDGKLTAGQYHDLWQAVLDTNIRKVNVPNSFAASRILRASEPE